ncbi:type II toxin-antitoxin system HicB family antitoxin [Acidithiobacillus sp.]|uniref:type II toxin-antitoxin system HicB family antitoxin n=1 Tax=Acidithiobacillus sp. TaxID=1872118 RepID=UPI0025BDF0D2|nr:type II toxin-antitoxin system HicB family antitoxin [Acidithiobacillus sp.]
MRRANENTLERIFARPVSANIQWRSVEALFVELGAEISEREHPEVAGTAWSEAMNIMSIDGYNARIEFDPELDLFRGEILGLNGGADFYGKDPGELRTEFKKSLEAFLAVCKEKGIEPHRHFSGRFNLRISPELHEQLAIVAEAEGKSINALAQEALRERIAG